MTFSYDLATGTGKMRLQLGDTTPGSGVKPDGGNFTDAELEAFLNTEATVTAACALAAASLANLWASAPERVRVDGVAVDRGAVSALWARRAREWRAREGIRTIQPRVYGVD